MSGPKEILTTLLRDYMKKMTDEERIDVIDNLLTGYCKNCGSDIIPCNCDNDD